NALVFPGIFRGALQARATRITMKMQLAAAHALAGLVENPQKEKILPDLFEKRVAGVVAEAVFAAWNAENSKKML
ncbi:MAG TPA: malic enzyme-like NAD(P)-binding protein, partial [Candidatus Paceibacterota bacterium]|nr:malic enzyme-like NAD(P)-binding protein [Candidatus Paceibacterota bacterium]